MPAPPRGEQVLLPSESDGKEFSISSEVLIYIEGNSDDWRVQSSRDDASPRVWLKEQRDNFRGLDVKIELKGTKGRVYRIQVDVSGGSAFVYPSEISIFG